GGDQPGGSEPHRPLRDPPARPRLAVGRDDSGRPPDPGARSADRPERPAAGRARLSLGQRVPGQPLSYGPAGGSPPPPPCPRRPASPGRGAARTRVAIAARWALVSGSQSGSTAGSAQPGSSPRT